MNAPIGVFDSGIGGLTVAKEIMRQIPGESLVYFGDTARVPYGSKSKNTVCKYSKQIAKFLLTQDVKAIVIACNTASALARNISLNISRLLLIAGPSVPIATGIPSSTNRFSGAIPLASFRLDAGQVTAVS